MKKSLRILSLVLSLVMILGSVSVAASAYEAYKGSSASITYDDVDTPVYNTQQYASMALDAVDNLLSENAMVVDIVVGTLDISSIDGTLDSVHTLLNKVSSLLNAGVLGDANLLDFSPIDNTSRTGSGGDLQVIYDLLDLIGGLAPIAAKYVNGGLSLGILNSFISSYMFDVRELVYGLLIQVTGLAGDDWKYFNDDMSTNAIPDEFLVNKGTADEDCMDAMDFAQLILNKLVLGDWTLLNGKFYEEGDKTSVISYTEYLWKDQNGNDVSDEALDTSTYDYYGFVHPDCWVTYGLGDAIRVPKGTTCEASYSAVDLSEMSNTYDFVESLFLQAYNGILVPVLNRITANWIREKQGYTFDETKTNHYMLDADGNEMVDANGDKIVNPNYDYKYTGEAPADGSATSDKIFRIFDAANINVPKYEVASAGYSTFVEAFNHNAGLFIKGIIKATPVVDGNKTTYTWTNSDDPTESYEFTWTDGDNTNLITNICSALKFLMNVTGDEFFSDSLVERNEVWTPAQLETKSNQELLAYVIRSVINANISYMYIPYDNNSNTIAGAGFQAVLQLAYQDIPQFTYTTPDPDDYSSTTEYTQALVQKGLAILMDIAAYNINATLDTNLNVTATDSTYNTTNNGSTNKTGLLGYLGDSGTYGTTVAAIAAWAVSTWASTTVGSSSTEQCLLALDLGCDNYNGQYGTGKVTEDTFWSDLDLIINSIVPIDADNTGSSSPDNRPWIANEIASTAGAISKNFVFNYLVYPIVNLDITKIETILSRNTSGSLAYDNPETIIVDTVHRIFDLIFPDVFDHDVTSINSFIQNDKLAGMVNDLVRTIAANGSVTGQANGGTIAGRGKIIAGVALPIVCKILGLDSKQEFGELENYIPSNAAPDDDGNITFMIHNGSSGVNTSYRDKNDSYKRKTDSLYTYTITSATYTVIGGDGTSKSVTTKNNVMTLAGGENLECTVSGTSGQMLEITFRYTVSDENGNAMGGTLSKTSYCYVTSSKGDDEEYKTDISIGGQTVQYISDIYLDSGDSLSSVDNYSLRIEDTSKGNVPVEITGVSLTSGSVTTWLSAETKTEEISQTLSGEGGTYVFMPFAVADGYARTEYEYQKDENDEYVLDDYGMKIQTGTKASDDTYVPDGEYVADITVKVNGVTGHITPRIHLYNDYDLSGLLDRCISANRSTASITTAGQPYWLTYYNAMTAAAAFVLVPNLYGSSFTSHIASSTAANKYLELYRNLYTAEKQISQYDASSGASAIWTKVNSYLPYNYTLESYTVTDSEGQTHTVYYRNEAEFYESGYAFVGNRNYVSHTYRTFKSAVNDANDLIAREYKFVGYSQEEYNELTSEEKLSIADSISDVTSISSVDSAYIIHKLELTYGRLIPLAGNNSKLTAVYNLYGGVNETDKSYSTGSWSYYAHAKQFAADTIALGTSATAEQINWATSKLVDAWKNLAVGANYENLTAAVNNAKTTIRSTGAGLNTDGSIDPDMAEAQETYTVESYKAYLEAVSTGYELLQDYANGKGLAQADQDIIDAATAAIGDAYSALKAYGTEDPTEEEASYDLVIDGEYEGADGAVYNAVIDDEIYGVIDKTTITVDDEEIEVTGALYGVPGYADEESIAAMFTVTGCTLEVVPNSKGNYGSGAVVLIKSEDDEVLACYVVSYRGDLNGDGEVTTSDDTNLCRCLSGVDGFFYSDYSCDESLLFAAADVYADQDITTKDESYVANNLASVHTINQATGRYGE